MLPARYDDDDDERFEKKLSGQEKGLSLGDHH